MKRIGRFLRRAAFFLIGVVFLFVAMRGLDGALMTILLLNAGIGLEIDPVRFAIQIAYMAATLALGLFLVRVR